MKIFYNEDAIRDIVKERYNVSNIIASKLIENAELFDDISYNEQLINFEKQDFLDTDFYKTISQIERKKESRKQLGLNLWWGAIGIFFLISCLVTFILMGIKQSHIQFEYGSFVSFFAMILLFLSIFGLSDLFENKDKFTLGTKIILLVLFFSNCCMLFYVWDVIADNKDYLELLMKYNVPNK